MPHDPILLPKPRRTTWNQNARAGDGALSVEIDPAFAHSQGYRLVLNARGSSVTASTTTGVFYAQQTLAQLRRQFGEGSIPQGEVEDWPDFQVRGVMLDISRDKVPTMRTLYLLVDLLAELKINQFQLYTEHTFAYAHHEEVWRHASPMTAAEIRELDHYCRNRHIELVPNQNSFGHMERWLKHERYKPLAEAPEGFDFPWGTHFPGPFSLNPLDPRSLELVEGLYDELLPNFTSKMFNVGCDETFDLGVGRSKAECERRGKERVYLDFLLKIYEAVSKRGRRMQFWGDIILHKPELIPELPKDLIALNWGYEAISPFEKETRAFADAGVPFYVCPGTSSWCTIAGRTDNALENLRNSAACGLAHEAIGYLNTDWGDLGHLQYLPISYLGFAAGAAYSWCLESNRDVDFAPALDAHVFEDSQKTMGRLVYDFGNVYRAAKTPVGNASRFFWSLLDDPERRKNWEVLTREEFEDAEQRVEDVVARLRGAKMNRADGQLIIDEIRNAAAMLTYACRHGRWRMHQEIATADELSNQRDAIVAEHRRLWLARNRRGGLDDSCATVTSDNKMKKSIDNRRSIEVFRCDLGRVVRE